MKKADNFNPGKWLVENKLTNQSRLNEAKQVVMINGKQVDLGSLELDGVDPSDYPDFSDTYIVSAKFTDGTDLEEDEIDEFNDDYYEIAQEMAGESLMGENKITEKDGEMDGEESEDIELFQFTEAFFKIINGVRKTKTDLKYSAGAMFGGASENYYSKLYVVLNEFYNNTYKPIEEQYVKDLREEEIRRRKLYPQK